MDNIFTIHLLIFPEKEIATHSNTLAWKFPWMEEPGRLQSTGSRRVAHDWVTSLSLFTFMHWRRKWQPTPVFLPGESQGRGSLVGCHLWGRRVRHDWSNLAAAAALIFPLLYKTCIRLFKFFFKIIALTLSPFNLTDIVMLFYRVMLL